MSWLESHQELRDHPKTARLRRRLGVSLPQAIGHLHLLWWWALDYAPTGHLAPYDADVIADAACWEDDPGVFVRALIGAGFLNDDMTIHDWDDYAGRLIEQREANARRKRRARQARRDELLAQVVSGARPAGAMPDTTGTSPGRTVDVQGLPDLTGPDLNRTGPDPSPPTPPSHGEGGGAADAAGSRRRRKDSQRIPTDYAGRLCPAGCGTTHGGPWAAAELAALGMTTAPEEAWAEFVTAHGRRDLATTERPSVEA